ncbi:MAG: flavin reductase [Solirubrobacterales bacterium]
MKQWICTICGYIHEGDAPPEECPICGAPASDFEPYIEAQGATKPSSRPAVPLTAPVGPNEAEKASFSLSYGLYIVTTCFQDRINGQIANTVFQLTNQPMQVAICLNKNNYTHELASKSGVFGINTLGKTGFSLVPGFGFRSGREADKFQGVSYFDGPGTRCPILSDAVAYIECRTATQVDVGTHTLFIAEVLNGSVLTDEEPMTYAEYRKMKASAAK